MVETDAGPFVAMLRDVFGLYPQAKPLTEGQVAMFFRALAAYPVEVVAAGLDAHVKDGQRGRFPPTPSDVIAQIDGRKADDGRPGADEGWAIAVRARDESATVVWTEELAQAWGVARSVIDLGDEVGARVAFREAYERLVTEARRAGVAPRWTASLGTDPGQRVATVREAVAAGRIGHSALPALEAPKRDPAALEPLLQSAQMPWHVREELLAVRAKLVDGSIDGMPPDPHGEDFIAKKRTDDLKREAQRRVDEYTGGVA